MADSTPDHAVRSTRVVRKAIADQIRGARTRANYKQNDLADLVKVSRTSIVRIENEQQDPGRDLISRLAEVLNEPGLVALADERACAEEEERAARGRETFRPRDDKLAALVEAPNLDRLVFVLADQFDLVRLLEPVQHILPEVIVVVPTVGRQRQLEGRTDTRLPNWDVQGLINDLFAAIAPGGALNPEPPVGGSAPRRSAAPVVKIYESDNVTQSLLLASGGDGTQCALWPGIREANRLYPDTVPALVTRDPLYIRHVEDHVSQLLKDSDPLTHLKAVVVVEQDEGTVVHKLSTFFDLGSDSERQFGAQAVSDDGVAPYGFAVALVLVHGVLHLPGRLIGRRVLLPYNESIRRFELLSSHLPDEDLLPDDDAGSNSPSTAGGSLRELSDLSRRRSTKTLKQARDEFVRNSPDYVVPADAFRVAAAHGIRDELGVEIKMSWLQEIDLPDSLRSIDKTDQDGALLPVLPRVFALDLSQDDDPDGGLDKLEEALRENADATAFGKDDLLSSGEQLNDFLSRARDKEPDWWRGQLDELGIQ